MGDLGHCYHILGGVSRTETAPNSESQMWIFAGAVRHVNIMTFEWEDNRSK